MKKTLLLCLMAAPTMSALGQTISDNTTLLSKFQSPHASSYSDIWGYAAAGREYALLGCYEGTSIIDVTNPSSPVEVAFITGPHSIWRDIKTHSYYAYVTHDGNDNEPPAPGVQIIDLSSLPATATLVNTYNATIRWSQPRAGIAEVSVFNLLGQRIEVFRADNLKSGKHSLQVNLNRHASGIYFYRVRVNDTPSKMRKMLLVR
jgi:hypothetical protein